MLRAPICILKCETYSHCVDFCFLFELFAILCRTGLLIWDYIFEILALYVGLALNFVRRFYVNGNIIKLFPSDFYMYVRVPLSLSTRGKCEFLKDGGEVGVGRIVRFL